MIFHRFRCFRRVIPFPRWTDDKKNQKNIPLQYAGWSPTGHGLTFVFQNNLYYQQSPDHTPYQVSDILGFQLTNFRAKIYEILLLFISNRVKAVIPDNGAKQYIFFSEGFHIPSSSSS